MRSSFSLKFYRRFFCGVRHRRQFRFLFSFIVSVLGVQHLYFSSFYDIHRCAYGSSKSIVFSLLSKLSLVIFRLRTLGISYTSSASRSLTPTLAFVSHNKNTLLDLLMRTRWKNLIPTRHLSRPLIDSLSPLAHSLISISIKPQLSLQYLDFTILDIAFANNRSYIVD